MLLKTFHKIYGEEGEAIKQRSRVIKDGGLTCTQITPLPFKIRSKHDCSNSPESIRYKYQLLVKLVYCNVYQPNTFSILINDGVFNPVSNCITQQMQKTPFIELSISIGGCLRSLILLMPLLTLYQSVSFPPGVSF